MSISTWCSVIFSFERDPAFRGKNLVPVVDPVLAGNISSSCFSSNRRATRNPALAGPFP